MPVTKYTIKRRADGYVYKGNGEWSYFLVGALWFDSMTAATCRAVRELEDMDLTDWFIEPIAEVEHRCIPT